MSIRSRNKRIVKRLLGFGLLIGLINDALPAQVIDTVAGGEVADGGSATVAALAFPRYLAMDAAGNLLISDSLHNRIRKVDPSGVITTFAGRSEGSFTGDGGPAIEATFNLPAGILFDPAGNLLVADEGNNVIRRINSNGFVSTIAGNGVRGFSGDGGPALQATFSCPFGLALDATGNLYVVDTSNSAVRKIDASGVITTVAGNSSSGFSGDGGPAIAAQLNNPRSVLVDAAGNLFIADTSNHRVRKVDLNGIITTVAGNGSSAISGDGGSAVNAGVIRPRGVALDANGDLLISSRGMVRLVDSQEVITTLVGRPRIGGFNGDGQNPLLTDFRSLTEIFIDQAGDLVLADSGNGRIRRISAITGLVSTVAGGFIGESNPATNASLNSPQAIALDSQDRLYIADTEHHRIRMVDESGILRTIAGTGISEFGPDGGLATETTIRRPFSVGVDSGGNVYFGSANATISRIDTNGILTTVVGNGSAGLSGDGGPANQASITSAVSIRFDLAGNLYFADNGACAVRKVDTQGIITTIAGNGTCGFNGDGGPANQALLSDPFGLALDSAGNIFIGDFGNNRVRKVDLMGAITTIAGNGVCGISGDGGPAANAEICQPFGVAADHSGNVFFADFFNTRLRRIDASGTITTIAGSSDFGFTGDGGAAANARLQSPAAMAVDSVGNVYFSDLIDYRVRKITFDPVQAIDVLIDHLDDFNPSTALHARLLARLRAARTLIEIGNVRVGVMRLNAFIDVVNANRGAGLSNEEADQLVAAAQAIIATT